MRKRVPIETIDDITYSCFKLLNRDMTPIDMGNLIRVEQATQMPCHLVGTQVGPVSEKRQQLSYPGIVKLGFITRERTEMATKAC